MFVGWQAVCVVCGVAWGGGVHVWGMEGGAVTLVNKI
jgi:hypothetical protein